MHFDTRLVHAGSVPGDPHAPTSTPIYQTATFAQEDALGGGRYDYTRSGNPTREVLERQLAELEGGTHASAFASGMAALTAITRLVRAGQRILAGSDLYGGTFRLLTQVLPSLGIEADFVDTTDLGAVAAALRPETALVLVETPTNPLQRIVDLRAVARLVHEYGALLAVDNTFLSPVLQRPLELGADLVVYSATKHLAGHGDATAGAVITRDERIAERVVFVQNAEGTALAPFESWLVLRGVQTLALRVSRAQHSARRIARFLAQHPDVTRVHYAGLPSHAGHALHASQADGPGTVVSFETGSFERSRRLVDACRLFSIAVSFGGVRSQISLPGKMSHASIPAAVRADRALPEDLVRVSVGIEDPRDLLADLQHALRTSSARVEVRS
ncbi:MAG: cystathionine beta-lyase [Planctomycetes bacterium]|nr:cystathionine beta-lyase [Planctomycetota bacterium]MCB9903091.1 cystathionine beta-lyase [Planctomycetota bacterium]